MKHTFIIIFLAAFSNLSAQTDWSATVSNILYNNCTTCHHPGGIAPFPLMTYQDAFDNGEDIIDAVNNRDMPPWPADPQYRHFAHEALLDSSEISAINDWYNNGMQSGDTTQAPAPPVYNNAGSTLDSIHFTFRIPDYTLQSNSDEYRYFAMHTNFSDTVYVSKIEVIPGLPQAVHHADIHYDVTGNAFYQDSITPLPGFSNGAYSSYYMNAWQPGGNIAEYPADWGIAVPPGADFLVEIHYGPGFQGLTDSTKMNLRFITNPVNVRPISVSWLLNNPIPSEGPLVIPADSIVTFHQMSVAMPVDRSLISICPHMHRLGKSYKVWFRTLNGDSVPLINIPQWDFHWQKYYMFRNIQKIPAGARIYSEAVYDNTVNNPENPHNPPITVHNGPTTEDEMLMTYFIFSDYAPGDENILLDSSIISSVSTQAWKESEVNVYPNPFDDHVTMDLGLKDFTPCAIRISDLAGRTIKAIRITEPLQSIDLKDIRHGMYILSVDRKTGSTNRILIRN